MSNGLIARMADRFADDDRRRMAELEQAIARAREERRALAKKAEREERKRWRGYNKPDEGVKLDISVTLMMDRATRDDIDGVAKKIRRSRSWVIRQAFRIAKSELLAP